MYKEYEITNKGNYQIGEVETIELGLTQSCNMHCPYCGAYKVDFSEKMMPLSNILHELKGTKSLRNISLSGGEVLINYDECLQLCDFCVDNGYKLQINTNASLLTDERVYELKNRGLDIIHISLNFYDADDYSSYYQVDKQVFYHLIEMIKLCAKVFKNCVVETILCDEFQDNIVPINLLLSELGVHIHQIQYGMTRDKWDNKVQEAKTLHCLQELFRSKKDDMSIYVSCISILAGGNSEKLLEDYIDKNNVFFIDCNEGRQRFHVHRNGDVVVCDIGFPYKFGNLFTDEIDMNDLDFSDEMIMGFLDHHGCAKSCILR